MTNEFPASLSVHRHHICIICEGTEDYEYLMKLEKLGLWSRSYKFRMINAKKASHIPEAYEYSYRSDRFELVLVFCDTDRPPHTEFERIREKLSDLLHCPLSKVESVIMYANPCTMQIMLRHFDPKVELSTQNKKKNAPRIEELTGVKDYDAHADQIGAICGMINRHNYKDMLENLRSIDHSQYTTVPSTNFGRFLQWFESDDTSWIDEINSYLRQE